MPVQPADNFTVSNPLVRADAPPAAAGEGSRGGSDVTQQFKSDMYELAEDRGRFYQFLRQTYGPGVSQQAAEQLRSDIRAKDFGFLGDVFFTDGRLGGNLGVHDDAGNRIVLRSDLGLDRAQSVFTEEALHAMEDRALGEGVEAAGDEGEIGRRLLAGETLTVAQLADLRVQNDFHDVKLDGVLTRVEAFEGGGGEDPNDVSDMEAEAIGANPGEDQPGATSQSPGEDISDRSDSDVSNTILDIAKKGFGYLANFFSALASWTGMSTVVASVINHLGASLQSVISLAQNLANGKGPVAAAFGAFAQQVAELLAQAAKTPGGMVPGIGQIVDIIANPGTAEAPGFGEALEEHYDLFKAHQNRSTYTEISAQQEGWDRDEIASIRAQMEGVETIEEADAAMKRYNTAWNKWAIPREDLDGVDSESDG